MADIIIFDSAAGVGQEALAAIESADELIIVTNPEIPAVTDALKTAKLIESMGKKIRGIIVTRSRKAKTEMPLSNISEMLELPILGVIPEDKRFQASLVMKDAILHTFPRSKPSIEYKRIAAKMIGDYRYNEKPGLFERFFR